MILYCVRHGESVFNAEGRIQGQLDPPLSDLGHAQSRAVAGVFAQEQIDAVYSSPLRRALDTAHHIADALDMQVHTDERLKEIHAGIFQGRRWDEITVEFPAEAKQWKAHDPDFVIPGGESRRQLMLRGAEALRDIREGNHERVIVVAHGGMLTAAIKHLLEVPAHRNAFSLLNCSISKIAWLDEFRLISLNESGHLQTVNNGRPVHSGDL